MLKEGAPKLSGTQCPFCHSQTSPRATRCLQCGARLREGGVGPGARLVLSFLASAGILFGLLIAVQQAVSRPQETALPAASPDGGVPEGGVKKPTPPEEPGKAIPGREPHPERPRKEGTKST